jgi:hypothetical protein
MDINTDEDHAAALREIDRLWNAPQGTRDGDRLDILIEAVERYEEVRWPIEAATLHLLRSPANAKRLNEAIANIEAGRVVEYDPTRD